jgi:(1->4)-alpha-D-glucan 1-alpha-D-glucosylmutase
MSQGGRVWPRADAFDGALNLKGYSVEGIVSEAGVAEVRLSALFRHLPVAVLKAGFEGALKPPRKRNRVKLV